MGTITIGQILLGVAAALVVSVFLAALRNPLAISVLNGLLALLAALFVILHRGVELLIEGLRRFTAWLSQALSQGRGEISAWDIIGPLLYFIFFVVLLTGEAYLAILTLPQLFHSAVPNINSDIFAPTSAVLWVVIFITIGAAAADLFGLTHFLRPYTEATGEVQRWLRISALVSLGLLGLTGILFGVFRGLLVELLSSGAVNIVLNVMFFFLLTIAALAAGFSLWCGLLALFLVSASILNLASQILMFLLLVPVNIIDKVAEVLVGVYDALALVGRGIWNYISQITKRKTWAVPKVADWVSRPHVWDVLRL